MPGEVCCEECRKPMNTLRAQPERRDRSERCGLHISEHAEHFRSNGNVACMIGLDTLLTELERPSGSIEDDTVFGFAVITKSKPGELGIFQKEPEAERLQSFCIIG